MTATRTSRAETLQRIIAVAVDGWGVKAVYDALDALIPANERFPKPKSRRATGKRRTSDALAAVKRLQLPRERKKLLVELVGQFEDKSFLPTLSDAKNFLEMRGIHAGHLKSRRDVFRAIFPVLQDIPDEGLARLLRATGRTGPARLGPLADAIRETGHSLRGNVQSPPKADAPELEFPVLKRSPT